MKIFILVLHFGDADITNRCLQSILRNEVGFHEVVIIDNTGLYSFPKEIKNKKITIVHNKKNLGYAGGMNKGIVYALSKHASHVFLLNNDVLVTSPLLPTLTSFMSQNSSVGIIAPAVQFKRGESVLYDLGGSVSVYFGKTHHLEVTSITSLKPKNVDYVSGCCMLIVSEVFKKLGYFDEQFFLYYEDVDYCMRAKHYGFGVCVLPKVNIYHELSKTIGKDSQQGIYFQTRSALLFGKKHIKKLRFLNIIFVITQSVYVSIKHQQHAVPAFTAIIQSVL